LYLLTSKIRIIERRTGLEVEESNKFKIQKPLSDRGYDKNTLSVLENLPSQAVLVITTLDRIARTTEQYNALITLLDRKQVSLCVLFIHTGTFDLLRKISVEYESDLMTLTIGEKFLRCIMQDDLISATRYYASVNTSSLGKRGIYCPVFINDCKRVTTESIGLAGIMQVLIDRIGILTGLQSRCKSKLFPNYEQSFFRHRCNQATDFRKEDDV
jgi:hypothetical protein